MGAKLFFLTGLLGIGGYVGYKATSYDAAVVPYSKAEVQNMLASAKTTIPRRDNDGFITIWGNGRSSDGVNLQMQYSSTAPVLDCKAVITELGPKESRVVADCGGGNTGSATADTTMALRAPMFDEHIQSKLQHREFDRSRASSKEMATVMQNMGGMQKEALRMNDQMQKMQSQGSSSSSSTAAGGWGADTPSSSQ